MDFKEINKETYNIISKEWETKRDYYWDHIVDFLKSFENKENINFLDLGCGSGRNLELAKELGFKNILGCDFSKELLKICENKGFRTNLSDLEKLNIEDNSQDLIICIAAHHHLLEKEQQINSLKEMRRILKENGRILLANWFPSDEFILKAKEKGKFIFIDKQKVEVYFQYKRKKYNRYYYLFKEEELIDLCKEVSFKINSTSEFKGNLYLELS